MDSLTTLAIIVAAWFTFYAAIKLFKVQRDDLEVSPIIRPLQVDEAQRLHQPASRRGTQRCGGSSATSASSPQ